jgi:archaetidylinositol phosphate synthase
MLISIDCCAHSKQSFRKADMSHDTWLHRSVRAAVRPLAATSITPNHITTARLATGLLAAGLFAVGGQTALYWAAGSFLLSMLLDRADGELARSSGKSTPWGHKYDLITDAASNALAFVGIGVGLRYGSFGWAWILMGVVAGAAIVCILWWTTHIENLHGARAAELRITRGFDPDDTMLIVPIAAVLGWVEPLLVAAFVGAPLFALAAYWLRWRSLIRSPRERS